MSSPYTIIDLFAGVGGLSLGFIENGFDLVYANDNDEWASKTLKANHKVQIYSTEDVRSIDTAAVKKQIGNRHIDVLVGGVPCQSFSTAGYRIRKQHYGEEDVRHYLFREFVRFAKEFRPDVVIIENVKGLVSMKNGQIKDEIIKDLEAIGYIVDFKVLNAADYGAPQLRQRVFFIGNRIGATNKFPEPTHSKENYVSVGEVLNNIPALNHVPRELSGIVLERVKLLKPGQNWRDLPTDLQTLSRHSGAYGRLDPNKPARTLTTRFDTPSVGYVTHPTENRTLTVREGARIQGFPDDFEFYGPVMKQYKQVGNAVPVYFSRALSGAVLQMLKKAKA